MAAVPKSALALVLLAASAVSAQDTPKAPESPDAQDTPSAPAAPARSDFPDNLRKPTEELIEKEQAQAEPYEASAPLGPPGAARAAWLERDPILRGLDFRSDTHCERIEVLVQPPTGGDDAHVQRVGWTYSTWARGLDILFRSRYAGPARREARPDRDGLIIVVVTQPKTFEALRTAAGARDVWDDAAFYAPQLPAVVVFDPEPPPSAKPAKPAPPAAAPAPGAAAPDPAAPAPTKPTRPSPPARPVLHAAVHALLDSYCDPGKLPPLWLAEGLAQQLSSHSPAYSDQQPSLAVFDQESLRSLATAGLERTTSIACLRPLTELTSIASLADLDRLAEGLPVPPALPLQGVAWESGLLLGWLDDAKAHDAPQGIATVVRWMAGHGGGAVMLPAAPKDLEGDFVSWTQEQISRYVKKGAGTFTLRPEAATLEEVRPGVSARPSDLAVPVGSVDVERARALRLASQGELLAAAARCKELAAAKDITPALAAELAVDLRLLPALADLRPRWAAAHPNKLLDFRDGEATLRTTLVRTEGDQLVVRDKGKERKLPMTALTAAVLAAQLVAPGNELKGLDDEARAYAWLIAGDTDWKDKTVARLRKDSGAAAIVLVDKRAAWEAALDLGRGLAELEAIAGVKLPLAEYTEAERDAWLARLKTVLADGAVPVVAERLPVLRSLGRRVLGGRFDLAPLKHLTLHGKVEELGQGRVRATWTFASAADLLDWEARTFDAALIRPYEPLPATPQPEGLVVDDGRVIVRGSGLWRCKLALAAPLSVDYDLRYAFTPEEKAAMDAGQDVPDSKLIEAFALRVAADDYGSGLSCEWFGHLMALDKRSGSFDQKGSAQTKLLIDTNYHMRLEHDGKQIRALLDGEEVSSASAVKRTAGAVEIWHHTQRPIVLDNLVVEGTLDKRGLRSAREAWVEAELAALGGG